MDNKKQGFTLVELIVVLVILGILAALLIPALTGYIDNANEKKAISECRQTVMSGQTTVSQMYANNTLTLNSLQTAYPDIIKLAEVPGEIFEIDYDEVTAKITLLVYKTTDDKYVTYEDGKYTVGDEESYGNNVIGYLRTSKNLLADAISSNDNTWTALRDLFKEQYGGNYPTLSNQEKEIIKSVGEDTLKTITWKPTIIGDPNDPSDVMLIASNSTSPNNAYMVYYQGAYYYHKNGDKDNSKHDSANINDQGKFDPSSLNTPPIEYTGGWVKVE